jgi:integrase
MTSGGSGDWSGQEMTITVNSEGPARITKASVESAWRRRKEKTRLVIRDAECRGLALVVNPTAMAWVFSYKPRGFDPLTGRRFASRSITIGGPASHTPEDARLAANRIKEQAKGSGADPAREKRAKQAADAARRATTISRLRDLYAADLPKRPKMRGTGLPTAAYVATELAHLTAAVATMKAGQKPAADLSPADLRTLLKAEAGRSAVARHRFGAVSRFLDWCLDEGHVRLNVCGQVGKAKRPKPPAARNRYLTPPQVAVLWKAAERMTVPVHRDFVRFLLVVPCRRNEAARLDWAHLDLAGATWAQPDKLTKNGEPHRFHLPALALDILRARHADAGEPTAGFVFPAPRTGGMLTTYSAMNAELDTLSGLSGWAWHDLRRSFATALGEAGFPEAVADAVLNHRQAATRGGVLGVYQKAERWPERRAAMEAWADALAAAINGEAAPASNVAAFPLRKAG